LELVLVDFFYFQKLRVALLLLYLNQLN